MFFHQGASIQRKMTLVMVATSMLGLSLACMEFEIYECASCRRAMTSQLSALADTLGAATTAIRKKRKAQRVAPADPCIDGTRDEG